MQGLFFRVDGADLETGEETYLVLQAQSAEQAEDIARRQGLLIANIRPATTADWGVSPAVTAAPRMETVRFEGVDSQSVEIVEPAMDAISPSQEDAPVSPSSRVSSIFAEDEVLDSSGEPSSQDISFIAPPVAADAAALSPEVSSWLASKPTDAAIDSSVPLNEPQPTSDSPSVSAHSATSSDQPSTLSVAPSAIEVMQPLKVATIDATASPTAEPDIRRVASNEETPAPVSKPAMTVMPAVRARPKTAVAGGKVVSTPMGSKVSAPPTRRLPPSTSPPVQSGGSVRPTTSTAAVAGQKVPAKPGAVPARTVAASGTVASSSVRPAGSPPGPRNVVPPRPLPPVVPPARPTRLTPPTVRRIPPTLPVSSPSAAPVAAEPKTLAPAVPAPVAEIPSLLEIESVLAADESETPPMPAAEVVEMPTSVPFASVAELQTIESFPVQDPFAVEHSHAATPESPFHPLAETATVDLAPAAHESQRHSSEVIGGSGIEQIITKIAWDQTAHAVEHSHGSALERLASISSSSYSPDSTFVEEDAAFPVSDADGVPPVEPVYAAQAQVAAGLVQDMARPTAPHRTSTAVTAPSTGAASAPARLPVRNPMAPLFYLLAPLGFVMTCAGIGIVIWCLMRVMPVDTTDAFDKVDFHLQILTQTFLGGMLMLAGMMVFIAACVASVSGAVRALRAQ